MHKQDRKDRTKKFAKEVIDLIGKLEPNMRNKVIGMQLLRSSTSVAANYRACCRAKSNTDFVYKINIAEEEADESEFWLELISDYNEKNKSEAKKLQSEADELTAIFVASGKTSKKNRKSSDRREKMIQSYPNHSSTK